MSKRVVNVVPNTTIKKELISDDDDEFTVTCKVCNKTFASEVALRNHARMEHIQVYLSGDQSLWTEPPEPKNNKKNDEEQKAIKKRTEEMLSSMAPTDLMTLASENVSYIIIKAEDAPNVPRKRVRVEKKGEKVKEEKEKKEEKEPQPITGPFECLQPSSLVADGTCHQIFFSCCEYSIHFRDEHTRRRKGLRCQVCEKPLAGPDDQAPYTCEVCGMGFVASKELSNHMATDHVKLKPFECNICHKRFTQQGGVQQHMRMHTGDRPFACRFCPKAFTQKSGLDQHLRIHTKEKPYRCVICQKTFCQSVHLRQHMRTHTQVAPFQCGICQKRFKQSSHLNYHLKNHNQLNMTDTQKSVYSKLMAMIGPDRAPHTAVCPLDVVEISEEQEISTEEVTDTVEVMVDEHEQLLAEQSIQVEEGETYILGDVIGDEQDDDM